MKLISLATTFLLSLSICVPLVCLADVHVNGYTRKDGSYVQPHYRSSPDGDLGNNWSTFGNINPHTGKLGTRIAPDYSSRQSNTAAPESTFIAADDDGRYTGDEDDEELDQFFPNSNEP